MESLYKEVGNDMKWEYPLLARFKDNGNDIIVLFSDNGVGTIVNLKHTNVHHYRLGYHQANWSGPNFDKWSYVSGDVILRN